MSSVIKSVLVGWVRSSGRNINYSNFGSMFGVKVLIMNSKIYLLYMYRKTFSLSIFIL